MLFTSNPAGFRFYWDDGSDAIEVFRPGDPNWAPFEVLIVSGPHRQDILNRIANEDPAYAKEL